MECYINRTDCYLCVAVYQGGVVGYHVAERTAKGLYLKGLFVDYAHQGKGIGRMLLRHMISFAKENEDVYLSVLRKNVRAKELYEKEEFKIIGPSERTFY